MTPVRNNQIFFGDGKKMKVDIIQNSISPKKEASPNNNGNMIPGLPAFASSLKKGTK
jgi:hypothetical protein